MLKRCIRCLIQENKKGGIVIGSDGICNYCKSSHDFKKMPFDVREQKFRSVIETGVSKNTAFDGLIMMSGGKDSGYLAWSLQKKYKLRLMAFMIDNGFEYNDSFKKAKEMCKKLNIPIVVYQPDLSALYSFYRFIMTDPGLKRHDLGQMCFYCGYYLRRIAGDFADALNIPFVFCGYNPNQIAEIGECADTEIDPDKIEMQKYIKNGLHGKIKETEEYAKKIGRNDLTDYFKESSRPITYYYQYVEYKPLEMMETIKKELGWKPIERYSKNYLASGCKLINLLVHFCKVNNLPNYVEKEFSEQIRDKVLGKEQVQKFYDTIDSQVIQVDEINEILKDLDIAQGELVYSN